MNKRLVFGLTTLALWIPSVPSLAAIIVIGAGVRNGDFNDDTSATDARSYADTPFWENIGTGDQTQDATRTNLDFDGSRNHVVTEGPIRVGAQDTGWDITSGDFFEISYVWRDAFNWHDASDQIAIRLFTTDDDLISGTSTTFSTMLSGTSTSDNTYESVTDSFTATAAEAGKRLFVAIDTQDGNANANGFARVDNFQLQVTPLQVAPIPEPATLLIWSLLAGLGIGLGWRRGGRS